MRKIFLVGLTLLMTLSISCGDNTVVLEENTKENQVVEKYKITERVVKNQYETMAFTPIKYNDKGVIGTLSSTKINVSLPESAMYQAYEVNENCELKALPKDYFSNDEIKVIQRMGKNYGIVNEGLHSRAIAYYYRDLKNDIKIPIENYMDISFEDFDEVGKEFTMMVNGTKINDDYYVETRFLSTIDAKEFKYEKVTIVDIKSEKTYFIDEFESWCPYFYYDNKENSIMALSEEGKVSKVVINDDKVVLEDYKTIDMKGLTFKNVLSSNNSFIKGDNLVMCLYDEKEFSKYAIYNIYSNEIIVIDNFIKANIEDSNFFVTSNNGQCYLSEINEEGKIELLYKLFDNEDGNTDILTMVNEEGNSIFVRQNSYDFEEDATSFFKDIKYYFIEIEKK